MEHNMAEYGNLHFCGLSENGGIGTTSYTMAGVLCVRNGAGFMYRKKFRERRFKKAS